MKTTQKILSYTVIFEPAEEGGYVVRVPALPGCVTQGETLKEAREMATEAIQGYFEVLEKDGDRIPRDIPPRRARIEKISIPVGVS